MESIQKPARAAVACPSEGCSEIVLKERNKRGGRQHCRRCRGVLWFGCWVKWLSHKQKHKRCEICFEEKLPVTSSIYKRETKCSKLHSFCHVCMATHILHRIRAKTAIIECPGIECKAIIDPIKCRSGSVITRESFVEWCDILAETWITDKGHRQAVCPYEGCSEVVIDECNDGGRQECPRCKRVFCFGCGVKWSRNHHQVCTAGEQIEQAFLDAARQGNWKRCPNCSFFIERRDGCNYMTCRCRTTFCYKCGVERCHSCR